MSWGIYGILIIFGIFVLLLILNPNLSCFGRRIKSPFYPVLRKKKRKIKAEDYGFKLVEEETSVESKGRKREMKAETYRSSPAADHAQKESRVKKKTLKTQDYGFSLVDDEEEQEAQKEKKNKDSRENK
jgi:hypothetical protein